MYQITAITQTQNTVGTAQHTTLGNQYMNKAGAKTITLKVGTQFSVIKANFSYYSWEQCALK